MFVFFFYVDICPVNSHCEWVPALVPPTSSVSPDVTPGGLLGSKHQLTYQILLLRSFFNEGDTPAPSLPTMIHFDETDEMHSLKINFN